jgi:hypothetical protein
MGSSLLIWPGGGLFAARKTHIQARIFTAGEQAGVDAAEDCHAMNEAVEVGESGLRPLSPSRVLDCGEGEENNIVGAIEDVGYSGWCLIVCFHNGVNYRQMGGVGPLESVRQYRKRYISQAWTRFGCLAAVVTRSAMLRAEGRRFLNNLMIAGGIKRPEPHSCFCRAPSESNKTDRQAH